MTQINRDITLRGNYTDLQYYDTQAVWLCHGGLIGLSDGNAKNQRESDILLRPIVFRFQ